MDEIKHREVRLQRELPFARELVWKAMTDPDHVNRWWGPDGFRNEDVTMDFRVGGLWSYTMVGPDGTRYPNRVFFKELMPPERMVFDHGDDQRVWFETTVTLEATCGSSWPERRPQARSSNRLPSISCSVFTTCRLAAKL